VALPSSHPDRAPMQQMPKIGVPNGGPKLSPKSGSLDEMPDAALELERNRSKRHHRATQPQEYSSDDEDRLPPNIHEDIATFYCAEPTVQVNDDQYSEIGH
jgi:hypothetical protein